MEYTNAIREEIDTIMRERGISIREEDLLKSTIVEENYVDKTQSYAYSLIAYVGLTEGEKYTYFALINKKTKGMRSVQVESHGYEEVYE